MQYMMITMSPSNGSQTQRADRMECSFGECNTAPTDHLPYADKNMSLENHVHQMKKKSY